MRIFILAGVHVGSSLLEMDGKQTSYMVVGNSPTKCGDHLVSQVVEVHFLGEARWTYWRDTSAG